jgi:hypothetical protein
VYLNGVPLTAYKQRALAHDEHERFTRVVEVRPEQRDNLLRIEVDTVASIGLQELHIAGPAFPASRPTPGDLHVVAIGVPQLAQGSREHFPDLPYAARDAQELVAFLRTQAPLAYRKIHVTVLAEQPAPTRANILQALKQFQSAGPQDTSLLFISAHGISDSRGNYYMLPSDARARDVMAVVRGAKQRAPASSLIAGDTLFEALRSSAGKRLLVVDTCHAKGAAGTFDARSLKKRSASSHFPLLLSSDSKELAQDYPQARHGLFTYALLRGLRGEADANRDRAVSLDELTSYVPLVVSTLQDKRVGVQTPQFLVPQALRAMQLVRLPWADTDSVAGAGPAHVSMRLER